MSAHTRLFVGNLPTNTIEANLEKSFSLYGEIINLNLKSKAAGESENKFAFITLNTTSQQIENCIRHFTHEDWNGNKIYVTKARESFLERLQREREQNKPTKQIEEPVRRASEVFKDTGKTKIAKKSKNKSNPNNGVPETKTLVDKPMEESSNKSTKNHSAEEKRLNALKKMKKDFNDKKSIIKTALAAVDKNVNKRIRFSDNDEDMIHTRQDNRHVNSGLPFKKSLFDDNEEDDGEIDFQIKEQFEGKKGQQVLELQSRYKSDKRFTLDERFVDDDEPANELAEDNRVCEPSNKHDEQIDVYDDQEKDKQMNILQNILGVSLKTSARDDNAQAVKKTYKSKFGMLRYDPLRPEHTKLLAPVNDLKQNEDKNSKKKKKDNAKNVTFADEKQEEPAKIEVSKEQFYKVSETLKEAITKPCSFSLRSLFSHNEPKEDEDNDRKQEVGYIPLEHPKAKKVKNPLEPSYKNPFKYDSSDSEPENDEVTKEEIKSAIPDLTDSKPMFKEKFFFVKNDPRFKESLAFFNTPVDRANKNRRELKCLMKKRFNNRSRKDQMFQKKIGGRRKFNKGHKPKMFQQK